MAFMMPIVKRNWDLYNTKRPGKYTKRGKARKRSEEQVFENDDSSWISFDSDVPSFSSKSSRKMGSFRPTRSKSIVYPRSNSKNSTEIPPPIPEKETPKIN